MIFTILIPLRNYSRVLVRIVRAYVEKFETNGLGGLICIQLSVVIVSHCPVSHEPPEVVRTLMRSEILLRPEVPRQC